MEEKKSIQINLSTALLIFAIIIIIMMGVYIYINNISSSEEISALKENANTMKNTIEELQGKVDSINNMNSSVNVSNDNNVVVDQSNSVSTNEKNVNFSDKVLKESLQNYLDLVGAYGGSPLGLLVEIKLTSFENMDKYKITSDNYRKTDIKYSDFKNTMLNYMTEDLFNTRFNGYKNVDGYVYYLDAGASGIDYEVKSVIKKGDTQNRYIAEVYNVYFDDSKELENIEFVVTNVDGKCVISYCD